MVVLIVLLGLVLLTLYYYFTRNRDTRKKDELDTKSESLVCSFLNLFTQKENSTEDHRVFKQLKKRSVQVAVIVVVISLALGLFHIQKSEKKIIGAVVSNVEGCAEIGRQMLSDGGSAADAVIATLLCEGVMLPHCLGIGGGLMATIYTKSTGEIQTLIARESAPAAAREDMFVGQKVITGALAIAVPGELLGHWEMHKKFGVLPWKKLFEPIIKLCMEGHYVSKYLEKALILLESNIRNEPTLAEIFLKEDGTLYAQGDRIKYTQLGRTYKIIAEKGINALYGGGEIGKMLVQDIQEMDGIITEQDLQNYKVSWENKHVVANIPGGLKLYTTPLPTSGVVLAFILNVMSDFYTDNRDIYWHRVIETFKHGYGHRSNLGDWRNDAKMATVIKETYNKLQNESFAANIRNLIHDDKKFDDLKFYGANFANAEDHGTVHVAVLAPNGDAISVTSTINNYFGCRKRSRRTGIILNDQMDDFSTPGVVNFYGLPASPSNFIQPGKRPMSSSCSSIILDEEGNVRMVIGSAGGSQITTAVATAIIKYWIFKEPLKAAIDNVRIHHQLVPMGVDIEVGKEKGGKEALIPSSVINYMIRLGHEILPIDLNYAAVTAIGIRTGIPEPRFDRRRVGSIGTIQA